MFPETVADKLSDAVIEQAMKLSAEDRQELVVSYIAKANDSHWQSQGDIATAKRRVGDEFEPSIGLPSAVAAAIGAEGTRKTRLATQSRPVALPTIEWNA